MIKVANPDLIKKDAAVTFEPTTNNKGLSAYAVKVIPESKHLYIAGERVKLTSIKSLISVVFWKVVIASFFTVRISPGFLSDFGLMLFISRPTDSTAFSLSR